ncbi:MAG: double-strand break repair helicase AddA, partial [Hyphomicrobiaceae bacterium]
LDYDDLILKTVALLGSERDAQWVLYKLDNGLEHILVDEAQDTSPVQWRIVARLAEEFFSGHGITEKSRTLFAVGDEKQSIYGFQGARPEMFAIMGERFTEKATAANHSLHRVPLTMSFRTVAPVLDAVDRTFAEPAARQGITAGDNTIAHVAYRADEPGLVEIWPTEKPGEPSEISAWRPLDEETVPAPIERLSGRIAATIRNWIDTGERLPSTGKPVTAGDILILVRRRIPVAPAMIRALKAAGIAVAGADRIRITEQIAVMDLMCLGDFVLLPDDDLALATILKSPLLGLDDDDLLAIAHNRKGSLWQSLLKKGNGNEKYAAAAETLKRWRRRADYAPPFEFFSLLLDREDRRAAILERLGPEAGDAVDEFLNQAIQYDDNHPPSLQGFLEWLRAGGPEIRRDMEQGRDEVRVMTVHGAKGLEAPIVFLPDTCSTASGGRGPTILPLGTASDSLYENSPLIWSIKGTANVTAVRNARDQRKALDDQEYRRLLYVAMTRARDRLYVAGYEGRNKPPENCWYNLVFNTLTPGMTEVQTADGRTIWRSEKTDERTEIPEVAEAIPPQVAPPKPEWMSHPAPQERIRSIPVMPSRIMPLEEDEALDALASDTPASPLNLADNNRFQRGLLTHALLQHLPALPAENRRSAAERFVETRGAGLPENLKASIVDETLNILEAKDYAPLFGDGSQAEVSIAAEIVNPAKGGRPLHVTGTIDRLIVAHDIVQFVDYKTNRPPPPSVENVAPAYIAQLAAYRLVLRQLYPGRTLEAALLWTDGARIMKIPAERLDAVEPLLWSADGGLEAAADPSYVQVN